MFLINIEICSLEAVMKQTRKSERKRKETNKPPQFLFLILSPSLLYYWALKCFETNLDFLIRKFFKRKLEIIVTILRFTLIITVSRNLKLLIEMIFTLSFCVQHYYKFPQGLYNFVKLC